LTIDAEHDPSATLSAALPSYTFDNIGTTSSSAVLYNSMSTAVGSGRYIQDDLPVVLPDGTSIPLSSLNAADGSMLALDGAMLALPGIVDGSSVLAAGAGQYFPDRGASHTRPTATATAAAATQIDSAINHELAFAGGSDSLSLGPNMTEAISNDELAQYLQGNAVLTEMPSDEFRRQFDGIEFQQQIGDSAVRPPQFSEH